MEKDTLGMLLVAQFPTRILLAASHLQLTHPIQPVYTTSVYLYNFQLVRKSAWFHLETGKDTPQG